MVVESTTNEQLLSPFKDIMEDFVFCAQELLEQQQFRFKVGSIFLLYVSITLSFFLPFFDLLFPTELRKRFPRVAIVS